jgi:hypothetical protein
MEWLNAAAGVVPIDPAVSTVPDEGVPTGAAADVQRADFIDVSAELRSAAVNMSGAQVEPPKIQQPRAAFVPRDPFDPEIFNRRQAAAADGDRRPATIRPRMPEPAAVSTEPSAQLPLAAE